ncbi:hypothetical protein NSQ26_09620 [Bacillus sp. FSL W7-1360]
MDKKKLVEHINNIVKEETRKLSEVKIKIQEIDDMGMIPDSGIGWRGGYSEGQLVLALKIQKHLEGEEND